MPTPAYLQPQTATIPLRAGLDRKTSDKAVEPPALLAVENASFDSPGEIKKDRPYQTNSAMTTVAGGSAAFGAVKRAFGEGVRRCFFVNEGLYDVLDNGKSNLVSTGDSTGGVPVAGSAGTFASTSAEAISEIPPARTLATTTDVDYAYANGFEVIVTSDFVSSFTYVFRDRETKAIVFSGTVNRLAAGAQCRAFACGTRIGFAYLDSPTAGIRSYSINTANLPTAVTVNVVSPLDMGANHCIDVAPDPVRPNVLWFAYHSTAGGSSIRVGWYDLSNAATSTDVTVAATPSGNCIAIGTSTPNGTTVNVMVAWCSAATGVNVATYTAVSAAYVVTWVAGAVVASALTNVVRLGVCGHNTSTLMFLVFESYTVLPATIYYATVTLATAVVATGPVALSGYSLAHKPFTRLNSTGMVLGCLLCFGIVTTDGYGATALQNYCATVSISFTLSAARTGPIAWYLQGIAAWRANVGSLPFVSLDSAADEYRWMSSERLNVAKQDSTGLDFTTGLSLQSLRINDGNAVPLYDTLAFASNCLRDRSGLLDIALHFAPSLGVAANGGGGGLVVGQTYEYIAVFEMIDSYGNVQRSVPSVPVQYTATTTQALVAVLKPFARPDNSVKVVVYRSLGGQSDFHYRVNASAAVTRSSATYQTNVADTESDATIATRERLYTDGGVLPNYPPPMGRHWAIHQNRIWSIDEHSGELRYTRELVVGEGPAWHPILAVSLATDRIVAKGLVSSPTGLWVLGQDKRTGTGAIAIVVGNGPADNGQGATYEVQRLEGCNVGIASGNAFVSTPVGICFEDPKLGIHLMPTGGGMPQPVGLPVESLRAGKTLVRPVLLQDRHEVRFVYADGFMLAYDYVVGQWFTRQLGGATYTIVDSCVWDSAHIVVDSSTSRALLAQATSGKDLTAGGTYVPLRITTGWLKLADFEGLQRVWDFYLLGTVYDACGLTVTIAYDYDETIVDTFAFTGAVELVAGALELRCEPSRQVATAMKISVIDSASASGTTHAGYGLVAIRMNYGVLGRSQRLPARKVKG